MTHPLALAVISSSAHYAARVENYHKMTTRHYRTFIHGLVTDEAHTQRIKFNVRSMSRDINQAVDDVLDYLQDHITDTDRATGVTHG